MLTIVSKDEKLSVEKRRQYYTCLCECGKEKSIRANDLERDDYFSCGCMQYGKPKYQDITNKRFGKLIAFEYSHTSKGKAQWLCECDCGRISVVPATNLQSKHTRSCGCIKGDGSKSDLPKHFRNILAETVKKTLKKSNYSCELTGKTEDLEVHHKISFKTLYEKAILESGLPVLLYLSEYTKQQIKEMDERFLSYHTDDILVVLNSEIHTRFHQDYGYLNNTIEQFDEFVQNYFS